MVTGSNVSALRRRFETMPSRPSFTKTVYSFAFDPLRNRQHRRITGSTATGDKPCNEDVIVLLDLMSGCLKYNSHGLPRSDCRNCSGRAGPGSRGHAPSPATAPVTTVAESVNRCNSTIRSLHDGPSIPRQSDRLCSALRIHAERRSRLIRDQSGAAGRAGSASISDRKPHRAV